MVAWALIEEVLKYAVAAAFILWRHAVDEAPDYVIYMITVALGFAAAENMLFLLTPIMQGGARGGIFTGDVRFLGSTLLHVVASASIGFALAFSIKSQPASRVCSRQHSDLSSPSHCTLPSMRLLSMKVLRPHFCILFVWVVAVVFFAAFEVLKYFQYHNFH